MMFEKPKNVKYTDMCIYIDNNIYNGTYDKDLVYQYLYHIVLMLASKARMFKNGKYYDDFALFGATRIYLRLVNKKQFELKENGEPKLPLIKSVLNYAKTTLYPMKVDFEQSEYYQGEPKEAKEKELVDGFRNILNTSLDGIGMCEFGAMLSDIQGTCRKFLMTIPQDKLGIEWMNIYTSVMLSFCSMVTPLPSYKQHIDHLTNTARLKPKHTDNMYLNEKDCIILFHLDESMRDYIIVLLRQLKHIISKELCELLHTEEFYDVISYSDIVDDYASNFEVNNYEY